MEVLIIIAAVALMPIIVLGERKYYDKQEYLEKLRIYKDRGGKCYKALRLDATEEEREAWKAQEETNKRALEAAGLTCLRAGSYVYFQEE